MSTELTDNQVRGYKATLHNPRVSDEAKEHAQQVLEGDAAPKRAEDLQGEEHQTHPLGGKKATLTDPNTSQQTERNARDGREGQGHSTRVLAGYKAALKNPNVSDEAKERAERVLQEHDAM